MLLLLLRYFVFKMKENLCNVKGNEKEPGESLLKMLKGEEICLREHSLQSQESMRVKDYRAGKLDLKKVGHHVFFSLLNVMVLIS